MSQPVSHHFCTYCDHNYLPRALLLLDSLCAFGDNIKLHVLCLDDTAYDILLRLHNDRVVPISLSQLLAWEPHLKKCQGNRSLVEFYFTCTPHLPLYVLEHEPDICNITYVDADLFFYRHPQEVLSSEHGYEVLITEHGFPNHRKHLELKGRHNVGLMSFRNSDVGLKCLRWYAQQCVKWCYDKLEQDRYADQKYLDLFADLFPGVRSLASPRFTLGPWNLDAHTITRRDGQILVDELPLAFFHFAGIQELPLGMYNAGFTGYGYRIPISVRNFLYLPYLKALKNKKIELRNFSSIQITYNSVSVRRSIRRNNRFHIFISKIFLTAYCFCKGSLLRP